MCVDPRPERLASFSTNPNNNKNSLLITYRQLVRVFFRSVQNCSLDYWLYIWNKVAFHRLKLLNIKKWNQYDIMGALT